MQQQAIGDIVKQEDEAFGQRMAAARRAAALSQRGLAAKLADLGLAIDPSAITRLEKGDRAVRLGEGKMIATALDVDFVELAGEPEVTPLEELEAIREEANQAMRDSRRAAAQFLRRTLEVRDTLKANPDLVSDLATSRDAPPESPDAYLTWVAGRLERVATAPELHLDVTDEDAEALLELSSILTRNIFSSGEEQWREGVREGLLPDSEPFSPKDYVLNWLNAAEQSVEGRPGVEFERLRAVAGKMKELAVVLNEDDPALPLLSAELQGLGRAILRGMPMHTLTRRIRGIVQSLATGGVQNWLEDEIRQVCRELSEVASLEGDEEATDIGDRLLEFVGRVHAGIRIADAANAAAMLVIVRELLDELDFPLNMDKVRAPLAKATAALEAEFLQES